MKIEFSKTQYKTLLLLTYLGDWVINAHKFDIPDDDVKELLQKIYRHHEECGEMDLVDKDENDGTYWTTRDLDDLAQPYIEEYDDESFWDELGYRLAERDFFDEYGEDGANKMTKEERIANIEDRKDYYYDEFERNGLENLNINKPH